METALTARLGIRYPVLQAPMSGLAGGALARAVSEAGGLGMISGGYGDAGWRAAQWRLVGGARIGCGFASWLLADDPEPLHRALAELRPVVVMLSFGDPEPFADTVHRRGALLMVQIQTQADAERAMEVGADVIVAQGTEAGGHVRDNRGTMPLVPAIVDLVAQRAPGTPVVAAGGIADGRGLAAALALGADGVLMGTRFCAAQEALVPEGALTQLVGASGDDSVRVPADDLVGGRRWPRPYSTRILRDAAEHAAIAGGQAVGLVHDVPPAEEIVRAVIAQAEAAIHRLGHSIATG
jgi:nitronate monooxygenase